MNKNNLHKVFYKEYFSALDLNGGDDEQKIAEVNNKIFDTHLTHIPFPNMDKQPVYLTVQYPGLITGIGIGHEVGVTGELKLGLHFDWTYGMPVIYGSSVKGVLRAWFMEFYTGDIDKIDLLMDIFSGVYDRDIEAEKVKYGDKWGDKVKVPQNRIYKRNKSTYERDIFFDAVIFNKPENKPFLCTDAITPHGGKNLDNPLLNPTPISFLKIAPGCKIEFRFKLVDSKDSEGNVIYTINDKKELFKKILTTVGIGAKTNVGYGQLVEN